MKEVLGPRHLLEPLFPDHKLISFAFEGVSKAVCVSIGSKNPLTAS